jgi:hypothetical protein
VCLLTFLWPSFFVSPMMASTIDLLLDFCVLKLTIHLILALLIFNFSFWFYLPSKGFLFFQIFQVGLLAKVPNIN